MILKLRQQDNSTLFFLMRMGFLSPVFFDKDSGQDQILQVRRVGEGVGQ
jgi:hypothetical protein